MAPFAVLAMTTARLAVLLVGLVLLRYPAAWLRPRFYPDGLNGILFMIVLLAILMVAGLILFKWVLTPINQWWEVYEKDRRETIQRLRGD